MKIKWVLGLVISLAFISVIAQIGENNLTITVTSDGKAKISQILFPKTYVSTIDVNLISSQISNMLVVDEKNNFLGTKQTENVVKIATLGASTADLKYNADIIRYEKGVFKIKYSSDQESRVVLPPLSKIVSMNTIPIEVNEKDYLLPPGDISISYTIRPVTSQEFPVTVGNKEYKIETISAAKIEEFASNENKIQFIIKDKATILAIIPTLVLANPDEVTLNNEMVDFSEFHKNGTHSWIRIEPHEKGLVKISDSSPKPAEGGGCLIATATYGSEMSHQVQFLREIRDDKLMSTATGVSFMTGFNQLYYLFSPTIADLEREHPMFREMVKIGITPMLSSLSILSFADSEHEIVGFGVIAILLNVGMYFALPILTSYEIKKIVRTRGVHRSNLSIKSSYTIRKTLKTSLFGILAIIVLCVSVPSAFAQSEESESPIKTILDLTRNNLVESLDSAEQVPSTAQTFYNMGQIEYEKAIAALDSGDDEAAREHALIAMALFEDSASIIGTLEESRVLDQLPNGFGNGVGSASEQGLEKGQGLGVGGIPPGIMKQMIAANIFEIQEEITDVEEEVEGLKNLISTNNLDVDLTEYNKAVNLAKEVLANGDIPNAQAKLALANEIKSDLYNQINEIVTENQDEKINEFVEKSISNIEELLSKGENLGLTKKAISELEDTLASLKSGNIEESLDKTSEKSKFANEIKENKEAEKELKAEEKAAEKEVKSEQKAEEKELKAEEKNNDKPKEISNGLGAAGDNPSDNGFANGQGLGLGKIPPGIAKLFGYEEGDVDKNKAEEKELKAEEKAAEKELKAESKEIPNGLGAAGDNPSDNGFANGQGLGLGNIPPGLARFDSFEESFSSSPDDFFENHFEAKFEAKFEKSFDDTKKGNGNGKGLLGDAPGKSGEAPGQNKEKKKDGNGNGNGNGNGKPDKVTGLTANAISSTQIDLSWTAPDDGGSPITGYQIEQKSGGGGWTTIVANTGSTTTSYSNTGLTSNTSYDYKVSAINANGIGGASSHETATTPTVGGNILPIANAGSDQIINENTATLLDGSGSSDSDGTIVSYSWILNPGPGTGILSNANTVSPTYTAGDINGNGPNRELTFTLTVTDNNGGTNSDTVLVTVINGNGGGVNNQPTVTNGGIPDANTPKNVNYVVDVASYFADVENSDSELIYTGSSVKVSGDAVVHKITSSSGTSIVTIEVKNNKTGVADITITATDAGGLSITDTFRLTVS
ncbi:MAG: fibronectin type III domain-containing protein [Nitrosarchaeum sp.]|nr:fibronectin type III domain-containing protein [Nitrosarchaeum sp.]